MLDLFDLPALPRLPVAGRAETFPVGRVFCVGRNYAAHAAEMGNEVDREAPFYFTKSAFSVVSSGQTVPYPPGTSDYHHEVEFVVAIGTPAFRVDRDAAADAIFGYGCGLDMTRRDLQAAAKAARRPWDLGKDVEGSAVLGPLTSAAAFGPVGPQAIRLTVDGEVRQTGRLSDMIHDVGAIVSDLSRFYRLRPGDVIMTGTPAGVGPVQPGDVLEGSIEGLSPVTLTIGPAA
ncbi:fumarylacetoacetate hydrolase family protein [Jannaschia sp. S6380]|uniref:fumarylacetoacetate hydrolase family protein n=1 Tax=Jannaschia sp. S6380 TaxID=2926408 RepID=UPI001FF15841|nr:fumarylacetoacetate hydrolase family protein [Jannaschia sp. S6380]MCK0168692.1 fumarylacetoacetate hydrolase family protein [Jannaschia sp. S6380]